MSESNRIKLLELAIQAGATIENATKVATDWEQWAAEDDPLRLGAPNVKEPKNPGKQEINWSRPQLVTNGHGLVLKTTGFHGSNNSVHGEPWFDAEVMNDYWNHWRRGDRGSQWKQCDFEYHGEIEEPKNPGNPEQEIDWGRPQLVHLIDDPDFIVRTTGLVGFDKFQGYSNADGDIPDWYKKKRFKYHGEIPQEQPKKPQFANAKDGDGTCGLSCCICAKEEPKTTGLNFLEAIVACKDGLRINRKVWHPDYWLRFDHDDDYVRNMDGDTVSLNTGDALATDWQIVKS